MRRLSSRSNKAGFQRQLKQEQRRRYWLIALAWALFIYTMAFFAVPAGGFLNRVADINFLMILLFLTATFFFLLSLLMRAGIHKTQTFVLTLSTLSIFAAQYFTTAEHAKQYHLIEYSFLCYLIYNAARLDLKGAWLWFLTFAGAVLIGAGDEGLQWIIPGRFPTWADVLCDTKAATFGLMFGAIVEMEKKLTALSGGRKP